MILLIQSCGWEVMIGRGRWATMFCGYVVVMLGYLIIGLLSCSWSIFFVCSLVVFCREKQRSYAEKQHLRLRRSIISNMRSIVLVLPHIWSQTAFGTADPNGTAPSQTPRPARSIDHDGGDTTIPPVVPHARFLAHDPVVATFADFLTGAEHRYLVAWMHTLAQNKRKHAFCEHLLRAHRRQILPPLKPAKPL